MTRLGAVVVLAMCGLAGCYLAHERAGDAGIRSESGLDAPFPDAPFPDAVALDAAPTCTLRCEPAHVLASAMLPEIATQGAFLENVIVTPLVTPDAVFGVLLASYPEGIDDALRPTLFRVSRTTGDFVWLPFPDALRTHRPLHAAALRLVADSLQMVVLQTTSRSDRRDAMVGRGRWSTSSLALTSEEDALLSAPFELVPTLSADATVFGGAERDFAVFADLGVLHAFVVPVSGAPELVDLVTLTDVGSVEPVSGTVLADGRIAVAGGGVPNLRGSARAPFFAIGRLEDAPLAARPIVGAAHDAPPLVVAEGSGYAIVRHVTNDADLLRSAIRIQHYASDDTLVAEASIQTTNGRRPVWTSAFATTEHLGLAWLEHDETASDRLALRLLTPDLDRGCTSLGLAPLTTFDAMIAGFAAAGGDDGTVYVVTVQPNPGPMPATVTVTSIPPCARGI